MNWRRHSKGSTVVRAMLLAALSSMLLPSNAEEPREARVSYVSGSSIYISVGRNGGLQPGDRLDVVRDDTVIATLEIAHLSATRASGTVVDGLTTLVVGDRLRLPRRDDEVTPVAEVPAQVRAPALRRDRQIRGRIGVRYLFVKDRTEGATRFSQPAADLRLDGNDLGGNWDLAVNARSRRTYRTLSDGDTESEGRTRVYRLALAWHDAQSRIHVTAGRQFSPSLASVSVFDGVMGEIRRERFSAGAFSGTQPDALDYGFSNNVREHGVYFQLHGKPEQKRRWSFTTGAITSYQEGEVNREFLHLQGLYNSRRLSASATQELDYNRDWKTDEFGEDSWTATSTYLSLRVRVSRGLSLRGGFDNRRNVRLFRDRVTPETDFDDSFRQGTWLGFSQRFRKRFRVDLEGKSKSGGSSGTADSYTIGFHVAHMTPLKLRLGYRAVQYTNDFVDGQLHSIELGLPIGTRTRIALTGALRDEQNELDRAFDERLVWFGIDLNVSVGPRLYLLLSGQRSDGEFEKSDQGYLSLTYRF